MEKPLGACKQPFQSIERDMEGLRLRRPLERCCSAVELRLR
jgi:hypothetical protein